jgi:hypothetical protein
MRVAEDELDIHTYANPPSCVTADRPSPTKKRGEVQRDHHQG